MPGRTKQVLPFPASWPVHRKGGDTHPMYLRHASILICLSVDFNPHPTHKAGCQRNQRSKGYTLPFWRRERDSNPRGFHPTVFKTVAIDHSAIPPTRLYHIQNRFEKGMAENSYEMREIAAQPYALASFPFKKKAIATIKTTVIAASAPQHSSRCIVAPGKAVAGSSATKCVL